MTQQVLGYAPMDHIHEEFVTLLDALMQAPDDRVPDALEAVSGHARSHFETENAWMVDTAFPARDCHIDEHAAVLSSIADVRELVARGDRAEARRLAQALADWFPRHVDHLDSALAHWMCKLRFGGKPVVFRRGASTFGAPTPAIRHA